MKRKFKATFVCEEHRDYGELGWRLITQPNFDPLNGMAIPHDVLEHTSHDRGTVEEEFQALGASLLVRDMESFYANIGSRYVDPAYHISGDVPRLMTEYLDGRDLMTPPATRPCDPEIEEAISRLFLNLADNYTEELPDGLSDTDRDSIRGWMRLGYRKAQKRYSGTDSSILCAAFTDACKQAEKWERHEGARQKLTIEFFGNNFAVESEEVYAD